MSVVKTRSDLSGVTISKTPMVICISIFDLFYAALIFVVDCNDRERVDEARQELTNILKDKELDDAILLVYANKNDLPNSMRMDELAQKLELDKLRSRPWKVQTTCALKGEGLYEGLEWIYTELEKKK